MNVENNKMHFLKRSPNGVITPLSEEEVKELKPSLYKLDANGQQTGVKIPLASGSAVPGMLAGIMKQDGQGRPTGYNRMQSVDSSNINIV